jgi:long-subunit acyl-CoA synthetase (AMP-forming)
MTETTGMATAQPLNRPHFGSVGRALPGVEIRIADDGEILLRGPNMVPGYLHMPEETAALYTDDGWLLTGDLGALDEDGFLTITGRKKDLLITAGGKNVAPAEMENHLQGMPVASLAELAGNEKVRAFLADRIDSDCNTKVARYQTIKKFEVLPHMLSVEGGELTPTMKVKRNVINDKYKSIIEGMYASGAARSSEAPQTAQPRQ